MAFLSGAVGALCLVLVACTPQASPAPPSAPPLTSGIRGIVLLGPTCAAQPAYASPCITPYATELVILDDNGNKVATVSSGDDGHFEIALPPGDYTIQPTPGPDGVPSGTPVPVTVLDDDYTDVEVDYDTGIR